MVAAVPSESLAADAGSRVRDWAWAVLAALDEAREEIDALNVFPVPDGDTGTNVYLTARSACAALDVALDSGQPLGDCLQAMARGALMGARGNSGVILAAYLGGVSDAVAMVPGDRRLSARDAASILWSAAERARRSVARPMEGTILTVARSAAAAAGSAPSDSLVGAIEAAARSAQSALQRTPEQLRALRRAGVVDAGGRALVVMLDAIVDLLHGRATGSASPAERTSPSPSTREMLVTPDHDGRVPTFEVTYLLDAPASKVDGLRDSLNRLGDSVVVAGDDRLWSVHVHADDAGAVIEAGLAAGRVHGIAVTSLVAPAGRLSPRTPVAGRQRTAPRAIVAIARGPGVAALMDGLGVRVVVPPPGRRPSAAEILHAITEARADEVLVLPGDRDARPPAEAAAQAARKAGIRIAVLPTGAVVQSLAAIAVRDDGLAFDEDAAAMTRACEATRYAAVTVATRQARTSAGPCEPGDVLGVIDGDVHVVGRTLIDVSLRILEGMLAVDGELVTCVFGSGADRDLRHRINRWLSHEHPDVDVTEVDGGQPNWHLIIGVE